MPYIFNNKVIQILQNVQVMLTQNMPTYKPFLIEYVELWLEKICSNSVISKCFQKNETMQHREMNQYFNGYPLGDNEHIETE